MEVSRSGRARKKSAKLLEMEEVEEEYTSANKSKRGRLAVDTDLPVKKLSPKAGSSPRKKNSLSSLLPHVAHAIGGAYHDADMGDQELNYPGVAPLQIDLKASRATKQKGKRRVSEMYEDSEDDIDVTEEQHGYYPANKKRRSTDQQSHRMQTYGGDDAYDSENDDDDDDDDLDDPNLAGVLQDPPHQRDDVDLAPDDELDYDDEETDSDTDAREQRLQMMTSQQQQRAPVYQPPPPSQPVVLPKKRIGRPPKNPQAKPGRGRGKSKTKLKEPKVSKSKGRPRTTAYTLWCNDMRQHVMTQYPELSFADVSKKLSQLWETVSVANKEGLKKKAKKIQRKQDLGEQVVKQRVTSTHLKSGQANYASQLQAQEGVVDDGQENKSVYKVTESEPIDVAAHLKLLGESLATIGARLQEHKGQIAVQGSLSVLLDSMLCALGPLFCLTSQVPEMNVVAAETHKATLDNLAYIMPGIG